jgi:mediator of RNA polymerase II transcription subunit 13, fungi type
MECDLGTSCDGKVIPTFLSEASFLTTIIRPLLYCQLQIHLVHRCGGSPYLMIHPLLLSTSFLLLRHALPLLAGTPIVLLPHGTPAFFLTKYTGPTSALAKQFHESLQGFGVSGWESSPSPQTAPRGSSESQMFILAWISVENKQGEDKGIIIIYPAALCLAFIPSSSFPFRFPPRQLLNYIPELPAPLQPSPQVPPAFPASTASATAAPLASSPISTPAQPMEPSSPSFALSAFHRPSSESLRAFRALTLSRSKDIQLVAIEVGGYVDAVARERERERERLKREREREASGPRTAAATPTSTSAGGPAPAASDTPTTGVLLQTQPLLGSSQSRPQAQPQLQQPPVALNQTQAPMQNFYPSPPQTNPLVVPAQTAQTSPVADTTPTSTSPVESTAVPPSTFAPTTTVDTGSTASSSTAIYDPLNNNLDSTWSAQPQPYLGMDMDIDIDFGLDIGMGFGIGEGGDTGMDLEDAFTEDDFSFFDQPSARASGRTGSSASAPAPGPKGKSSAAGKLAMGVGPGVGLGIGPALTPPLFSHNDHPGGPTSASGSGSGPGPPLDPSLHQPPTPHSTSDSTSHFQTSPFDPRALTPYLYPPAPDLLPPSPGHVATPSCHSVPPTPTVHLEPDTPSTTARIFDPIPFSAYHRALDGKYAVGKFAFPFSLPSPPDEEDRTEDFTLHSRKTVNNEVTVLRIRKGKEAGIMASGWRSKYLAATDPRIGVVRKLIGVKRKIFTQGGRDSISSIHGTKKPISPAWIREHEDWEKSSSSPKADMDSRSEADSESEEDEDNYAESPIISRPSTPPPAYLPLGPTLLFTHFEHSQLLPLSTPLRPPGAAVAPTNITLPAPAASVPTPVSPAATMGAASEQSKSLEAAALTLAMEVVENPPWADAWRANSSGTSQPSEVWPADVQTILQLLDAVPGLESPLDIRTVFGLEAQDQESSSCKTIQKPIQLLDTPMISIGKGDAVIQILPTALRFWEKLGLGPRGGRKNGTSFVLFEDGEQRQQQVESWIATISAMYEVRSSDVFVNDLHMLISQCLGKTSWYPRSRKL